LVALSREVNDSMASHGVERLADALAGGLDGKTVLILGLAYRGGVKEAELSSALLVADALRQHGAHVLLHDPLFTPDEIASYGMEPSSLPPSRPVDAVVLQAAHPEYADLDYGAIEGCKAVLDGRGALDAVSVRGAGLQYIRIGSS
jgi:UDP-N-acetyl-D-mannosaminuronate dehydrogenase